MHTLFMRLHTRTMIRDDEEVFPGSQSLRTAELDARREVELIFHEPKIAARMIQTFEEDWKESQNVKEKPKGAGDADHPPPARKVAKKVAKTVVSALPPVAPVLEVMVEELSGSKTQIEIDPGELEATVKDAVKSAIQDAVASAVEQASKEAE